MQIDIKCIQVKWCIYIAGYANLNSNHMAASQMVLNDNLALNSKNKYGNWSLHLN